MSRTESDTEISPSQIASMILEMAVVPEPDASASEVRKLFRVSIFNRRKTERILREVCACKTFFVYWAVAMAYGPVVLAQVEAEFAPRLRSLAGGNATYLSIALGWSDYWNAFCKFQESNAGDSFSWDLFTARCSIIFSEHAGVEDSFSPSLIIMPMVSSAMQLVRHFKQYEVIGHSHEG
jgi:hypothetical protein